MTLTGFRKPIKQNPIYLNYLYLIYLNPSSRVYHIMSFAKVKRGAAHSALQRLEYSELIRSILKVNNRNKKFYIITRKGKRLLELHFDKEYYEKKIEKINKQIEEIK